MENFAAGNFAFAINYNAIIPSIHGIFNGLPIHSVRCICSFNVKRMFLYREHIHKHKHTHTPNASLQYPFQYTRINFYKYISISDSLEHIRFSGSQNTNGVNSLNLIMGCHSSANTTLFNGLNISIFQKVEKKASTIPFLFVWFGSLFQLKKTA